MGAGSSSLKDVEKLIEQTGQSHLTAGWNADTSEEDKARFLKQVTQLDASYPGGVRQYITNARKLLAESKAGFNPLEGWVPSNATGVSVEFGSDAFIGHEKLGVVEMGACGFVLVAGGLGERLGFSGIKVALPWQITSGETFLELYIRSILAMQRQANRASGKATTLPLAIMVSDDTHDRTAELLKANNNFGMAEGQVTLLKQEKVACLSDNEARLSLDPKDPFQILTKPHGHGDVHYLLHSSGTLGKWKAAGLRWVYFFQDTNSPTFKVLPATLGVSKKLNLHVNSVCVPRMPGESIGGLMRLTHKDGRAMTTNVEYNQIDALLRATVEPRGDVAAADGFSPYPGSINQLLFALGPYEAKLRKSGGMMPEFVNPKYTDGTKTAFKSPTRLECMMQDYPKSLEPSAPVGFTIVTKTTTFSPVKTNLADAVKKSDEGMPTYSAASGEADAYKCGREMLAACGVPLQPGSESSMAGVRVELGARVVIDPSFGIGLSAWKARLPLAEQIKITSRSTLLLQGDVSGVSIEQLDLDGTLVLRACEGAKVTLKRCNVSNAGWSFKSLWGGVGSDEALAIRGYSLSQNAQRELVFDKPGEYIVEDEEASARLSIWWGLPAVIALLVALLCAAFWPLPR